MSDATTGQMRAEARLTAKLRANAAIYRGLPEQPITRQVARAKVRGAVKAALSKARLEAIAGRRQVKRAPAVAS